MTQPRPPIVVILGHVDHGKTSLLDALRKTNIATREAGGITQSTRAFQLQSPVTVTFIDTPGHAAFSAMRTRGGQIADIAILVVSAVDGVMPQTKESITTIKEAGIPMIVAINKMDLPGASADTIKAQLTENEVLVEGYGGDVPTVPISAKTGSGLPELLEMISLVSSLQSLVSDPSGPLECVILESHLDARRGPIATGIVKNGTLKTGQELFLDKPVGKAKALSVDPAPPSTPVEILGLTSVVPVGSLLTSTIQHQDPTSNFKRPPSNHTILNVILKADVLGSLEAITFSLPAEVNLVSSSTGEVLESDVLSAASTNSQIIAFNVKVPASSAKLADVDKVKIHTFNIIYELLDALDKLVHPQSLETIVGEAQIIAEFKIDALRVAGCKCTSGEISKSNTIKIGDKQARIKSLKMGKTEVEKVKTGQEFGAVFAPPVDFKIGENIIAVITNG
ncbi:MAG: Translation initiation factor IF-2 [Candidatus Gottesmanbacteria bacterium GW2011_GWA1_48_13]|uniref:Translation initiation factor IF-2 n=1 Tax=Candidatus Gottesmanbacteria bacterium GW2011_GWA1_48_13 TaxID=1618439 RepID=A0A0G1UMR4_9BACT|nr:MAG: Translation initiation factor IF-2 [Candidatus Gottesmanbacteria bacterium GW2011_GWA1_48_13]